MPHKFPQSKFIKAWYSIFYLSDGALPTPELLGVCLGLSDKLNAMYLNDEIEAFHRLYQSICTLNPRKFTALITKAKDELTPAQQRDIDALSKFLCDVALLQNLQSTAHLAQEENEVHEISPNARRLGLSVENHCLYLENTRMLADTLDGLPQGVALTMKFHRHAISVIKDGCGTYRIFDPNQGIDWDFSQDSEAAAAYITERINQLDKHLYDPIWGIFRKPFSKEPHVLHHPLMLSYSLYRRNQAHTTAPLESDRRNPLARLSKPRNKERFTKEVHLSYIIDLIRYNDEDLIDEFYELIENLKPQFNTKEKENIYSMIYNAIFYNLETERLSLMMNKASELINVKSLLSDLLDLKYNNHFYKRGVVADIRKDVWQLIIRYYLDSTSQDTLWSEMRLLLTKSIKFGIYSLSTTIIEQLDISNHEQCFSLFKLLKALVKEDKQKTMYLGCPEKIIHLLVIKLIDSKDFLNQDQLDYIMKHPVFSISNSALENLITQSEAPVNSNLSVVSLRLAG